MASKPARPNISLLNNLFYLTQLALIYNAALLLSVTLNLDWAKPRAAGGQFDEFPLGIRFIYFGMFVGMVFLMMLLWRHRVLPLDPAGVRLTRIIGYVFIASTFVQLISRSPEERTNALPASLISLTFLLLSKRDRLQGTR
jgi:hypothetical protein